MTPDELLTEFGIVRRGTLSLGLQLGRLLDEQFDRLEELQAELAQFVKDMERIKFYAARRIWAMRSEQTPSGAATGETWEQWFERMFKVSLRDYARQAKDSDLRARVMAYEIETFGWSPLDSATPKKDDAA